LNAELTLDDLDILYDKAVDFCKTISFTRCTWLYRNRWPEYFNNILRNRDGIMEVYVKDNNGDQTSPINGKLYGLFFATKNVNGRPLLRSPFGSVRFQVPARVLLTRDANLYFTDFYCPRDSRRGIHYVTLVVTEMNSAADRFCQNRLLQLNCEYNPFLFRSGDELFVNSNNRLHVELFYTENIDIIDLCDREGAKLLRNMPTFRPDSRSTPGGIPKHPYCRLCNLP
jgi:Phytanoyl-CoA hydroxylase-interacting protein C-terminus